MIQILIIHNRVSFPKFGHPVLVRNSIITHRVSSSYGHATKKIWKAETIWKLTVLSQFSQNNFFRAKIRIIT